MPPSSADDQILLHRQSAQLQQHALRLLQVVATDRSPLTL